MEKEKRLIQYSAFAACFLLLNESKAEAIYTDVNPDSVLANDNEYFNIDLDNNGIIDFQFKFSTGWFYTDYGDNFSYFYYIHAGPYESGNRIAGIMSVIHPSYGGFTQYFPYALAEDVSINEDLAFQNNNFQVIAYMIVNSAGGSQANGGKWFDGVDDHYIGVRFYDEAECLHYGWIRCDVKSDVDNLIIKDYAYESKCDVGIKAGDTIGDTLTIGINEINSLMASVYSFENTIYINVNDFQEQLAIEIYDLSGKLIYSDIMKNNFFTVELNQQSANYILKLYSDNKKFSKKVFIN